MVGDHLRFKFCDKKDPIISVPHGLTPTLCSRLVNPSDGSFRYEYVWKKKIGLMDTQHDATICIYAPFFSRTRVESFCLNKGQDPNVESNLGDAVRIEEVRMQAADTKQLCCRIV